MRDYASQMKTQRKPWVDALRAIAILLVMYGHLAESGTAFYVFTSPIKIPLFFAVSGYVFNHRNGNWKAFGVRLLESLVIPWLILSFSHIVLVIPKGLAAIGQFVISVLVGDEFWYLPCCILAEIVFFILLKYLKKQWQVVIAGLILTIVGLLLSSFAVFDLFKFATALIAQCYLLIGYSFRKYETQLGKIGVGWLLAVCGGCTVIAAVLNRILPEAVGKKRNSKLATNG